MKKEIIAFDKALELVGPLLGKKCCHKQVGLLNSLSLGFGKETPLDLPGRTISNFDWIIGTFESSWRVIQKNKVLCGRNDLPEVSQLDLALGKIEFGHLIELQQVNHLDVRAVFDNEIYVDFLATVKADEEQETFHMLCPNNICICFYPGRGWAVENSRK